MVVFFDIDGTIVDDATQIIPDSTVRAIGLLRQNGHIPVVNTGRPYGHIDPRVRQLDFSGWICACGMEVIYNGDYLRRDYPSAQLCARVAELSHRCGMLIQAESETELLYDDTLTYTAAPTLEAQRLQSKGIRLVPIAQAPRLQFIKFVTHDAPGCRREEFLQAMSEDFDGFLHDNKMVEFVKRGNSKSKGMELLMQVLGVSAGDTLAIGDSSNDLPMFRLAGTTVCMGGGMAEAKAQADYVTDTVLNDGIFKALKHFGLI